MPHSWDFCPSVFDPFVFRLAGPGVSLVRRTLLLGLAFLWQAWRFARELNQARARALFYTSIIYLPLLLILMVIDKVRT